MDTNVSAEHTTSFLRVESEEEEAAATEENVLFPKLCFLFPRRVVKTT